MHAILIDYPASLQLQYAILIHYTDYPRYS
jgi:hypothetical protein